jgi:sensor c-di-GMP phosphodiesterase-like protein
MVRCDVTCGVRARSADPCSDSNLAIMRRFDLSASYLQASGYVVNDHLVCSSQGRDGGGLSLGPVDWVTPIGVRIRINVRFPFDPVTGYLVLEGRDGFAAIINKDLPLNATTSEPDVSLAAFSSSNGHLMAQHGFIDPKWVGPTTNALPKSQRVTTFVDHGYVVAAVRSNRYYVGTIAALPVSYMVAQSQATTHVLLPVGLIAGIVLAVLESIALDFLKIDKSFVDTMNMDTPTSQVALHIIEMAKSLNLKMVAEGVETEAQALFLRDLGVQYAQGFLFSKPMPMSELIVGMAHSAI